MLTVGSEPCLVISSATAGAGPTVAQTFALLVASVQVNILPDVVLRITVPTPPAGLVVAVGSEACDSTTFEVFQSIVKAIIYPLRFSRPSYIGINSITCWYIS